MTASTCPRCGARLIGGFCLLCLRRRTDLGKAKQVQRKARRVRAPRKPSATSDRVADIHLEPWLRHMASLPVFGGPGSRLTDNLPRLHVRRASTRPRRRLAFADYDRHLIHLTDFPGITPPEALETLLHEVVHLSSLDLRRHDGHFKRTLARAALECFGVDCTAHTRGATWALDCAVVEALRGIEIPPLPPETP